ncbi:MAG: hypothetical protein IKW60_06080 [Clostridia bacterium]|nr:hypothetical protein [Clostridia bacterium]
MKEKILSVSKKIAVILIASIMVLGVVPISMITMRSHTADAKGAFLRFFPEAETVVMARTTGKKQKLSHQEEGVLPVGADSDAYLRFHLQDLIQNKEMKEINEATLRLTFLKGENQRVSPVQVWLMPSADWHRNMDRSNRPPVLGEIKLTEITPDFSTEDAVVAELDLTPYISRGLKEKNPWISLHLSGEGSSIAAAFAGTDHEDALYRPCLKIVTGEATDPDTNDISKVWLEKSARNGNGYSDNFFHAGKRKEFYLKFNLKPENIRGAMYESYLQLHPIKIESGAELQIYQLSQGQWEEGAMLPDGEEHLIATITEPEDMKEIDLTDAINDAYARGETSLTLRMTGNEASELVVKETPRLIIHVSDNPDAVAVTEAAIYALEDNISSDRIIGNLSSDYTTEHGVRAEIRWKTWDPVTEMEAGELVSSAGEVTRPKWYENSRTIHARATISAKTVERDRVYRLTILPEDLPEYMDEEEDTYLNLGVSTDEEQHHFAARGGEEHRVFHGGKSFSYRTVEKNDILAMTMKTDGASQNYLTLKVWKTQQPSAPLRIENLKNRELDPMKVVYPAELSQENGFLYLTYPIPMSWTEGENRISIRIYPQQTEVSEWIPWEIYNIYTGQTLYFDPLTFAEQGERFAGKETGQGSAFLRLLRRVYLTAKRPWEDFTQRWKQEETDGISVTEELPVTEVSKNFVWMETEPAILAFEDQEDQIVVSLLNNRKQVRIHRASNYYDTYAETKAQEHGDGLSVIDYGMYQILRNMSGRERQIPWRTQGFAGIYQNIADGNYYVYLDNGQMADDSGLLSGTALEAGENLRMTKGETLILKQISKPLYQAEWRIRAIDDVNVSQIMLNKELSVSRLTVKNMGTVEEECRIQVLCCVYEGGKLAGFSRGSFTTVSGQTEYPVALDAVVVKPGQTMKIFVEEETQKPGAMIPKLQLP